MIEIENLHRRFGEGTPLENHVLRGINLNIQQGEFVTVIGSNGAGKSTLLNLLSGELPPTLGSIHINQKNLKKLSLRQRSALVSRVFQDPLAGSCENLTIEENLALADARGQRRGLRAALQKNRQPAYCEALARLNLGLETRLDDLMGQLSGGQRQAVSLLMASLRDSSLLLLDEHTAALDPKTSQFVLDLTRELIAEKRLTTLMVTHSMKQALEVGSRTIMLHQGKVVFDIAGSKRDGMEMGDLLKLFTQTQGSELDDDALLLG